jgi:hypothetical protein
MIRRAGLILLLSLGIVIALDVGTEVPISPPSGAEGAQLVDRWLAAMASTGADRGWRYLSTEAQAEGYGDDQSAYLADVSAVDWQTVRWGQAVGNTVDDEYGVVYAYIPVLSDPRTLPHFLLDRDLVAAKCGDRAATQILAQVPRSWFQSPRLARVNNGTGSADLCEDLFYADTGPMRPPADLVGWAWATGGNASIRVEVIDETGLVVEASGGRDEPAIDGDVTVSEPIAGQVAVAWVATDCSEPVQLVLRGNADAVALELIVGEPVGECPTRSRTYEVMLRFSGDVSADEIVATRR